MRVKIEVMGMESLTHISRWGCSTCVSKAIGAGNGTYKEKITSGILYDQQTRWPIETNEQQRISNYSFTRLTD